MHESGDDKLLMDNVFDDEKMSIFLQQTLNDTLLLQLLNYYHLQLGFSPMLL